MEPQAPAAPACADCGAPLAPAFAGQTLCDSCQGLTPPEPTRSPMQDAEVAGYRLDHEIGAGRFSTSWLAEDGQGRHVVVKLLRRYAPDPNSVQRFLSEAQRIANAQELVHPHIARLVEGGVHLVSAFFLVYDPGGESTLADELRTRGRIAPGRALEICAQLGEGLSAMHRAGMAHLDLKPANVGLTRNQDGSDRAILLDFATAHLLLKSGVRETARPPLSTAGYLAPEVAVDGRSDVYALGALLFQLISGRLPVAGANVEEILAAHRDHAPLRLRDAGRRVHPEVERLLMRLLAKDPTRRPGIDEVPVWMRSLAAVAETVPEQEGPEFDDDPVPVVYPAVSQPGIEPRPALDPALERAMMGEVPPQPVERWSGIPSWAPRKTPGWLPGVAIASGVAALGIVLFLALRGPAKAIPSNGRRASSAPARRGDDRPPAAAPTQDAAPAPPAPATPRRGPYAKKFEQAQRALWTGRPSSADKILRDLLRKKLSAADRSRAAKMMGDTQVKRGNKPAAVVWYRKALQAAADPAEKDRINEALSRVNR